uniref:Uncharacterized protein n=1 Tax=Anguilla anguilla TaxID=7936 RepID=A0A0E9RHT2_ANGAN
MLSFVRAGCGRDACWDSPICILFMLIFIDAVAERGHGVLMQL